ncbi:MAG: histidinol-phosphatase HisJ family protein [Clostridiales bacterium]|nr:histidinol-phosphatase HisJ family protein [Clostridiales bacterium]
MSYRKLIDTHTHTENSSDGHHSTMFLCEHAEFIGLRAITFTDHVEIDYYERDNYSRVAKQSYFEIAKARSAFRGKLLVCTGVELGQPMYDVATADKVVGALRYDQVIASIHNLRGMPDFMFLDYNVCDVNRVMLDYFKEMQLMVDWGNFDTLGHLTYPLRYIQGDHGIKVDLSLYAEQIDGLLQGLVEKGKALEINTSGLRQKLGETMPGEDIICRFKELGGEYITIGSDAHYAKDLAAGIPEGMAIAERCGFKAITLYQKREPIQIPIE